MKTSHGRPLQELGKSCSTPVGDSSSCRQWSPLQELSKSCLTTITKTSRGQCLHRPQELGKSCSIHAGDGLRRCKSWTSCSTFAGDGSHRLHFMLAMIFIVTSWARVVQLSWGMVSITWAIVGFGWFILRIIWSKLSVCGYYNKKFCYITNFDNDSMKVAR